MFYHRQSKDRLHENWYVSYVLKRLDSESHLSQDDTTTRHLVWARRNLSWCSTKIFFIFDFKKHPLPPSMTLGTGLCLLSFFLSFKLFLKEFQQNDCHFRAALHNTFLISIHFQHRTIYYFSLFILYKMHEQSMKEDSNQLFYLYLSFLETKELIQCC